MTRVSIFAFAVALGFVGAAALPAQDGPDGHQSDNEARGERPRRLVDLFSLQREKPAELEDRDAAPAVKEGGARTGGLFSKLRRGGRDRPAPSPVAPEILASSDALPVEDRQALLAFHNEARLEVGSPPLSWSPELARFAQEWADEIARSGDFRHRPRRTLSYGENLAIGTAGAYNAVSMARQWYAQRGQYRAGSPIRANAMAAGHYTQMVWRGSGEMGAGIALIRTGPRQGMLVLVCNYDPPGNVVGEAAF